MITRADITRAAKQAGVQAGRILLIHVSMKAIAEGRPEDGKGIEGGADAVIDGLLDAVGERGTLCAAGHSRFGPPWLREPIPWTRDTPCLYGQVPNAMLARPECYRSSHPTCSMLAIGAEAEHCTGGHTDAYTPCGYWSPWTRLNEGVYPNWLGRQMGLRPTTAQILRIGFHSTTLVDAVKDNRTPDTHCTEEMDYWVDGQKWDGMQFHKPAADVPDEVYYPRLDRDAMWAQLEAQGNLHRAPIGDTEMICFEARACWNILSTMIGGER